MLTLCVCLTNKTIKKTYFIWYVAFKFLWFNYFKTFVLMGEEGGGGWVEWTNLLKKNIFTAKTRNFQGCLRACKFWNLAISYCAQICLSKMIFFCCYPIIIKVKYYMIRNGYYKYHKVNTNSWVYQK